MSIKHSLLALLHEDERHGYELRSEFEQRTGGVWPLNVGQVYSTLERLERDGLVMRDDSGDVRQVRYSLTNAGIREVERWWSEPVPVARAGRDDVALKIALAVTTAGVDARAVIHDQRRAVMASLQDLNRTKRASTDAAWDLVADALIFRAEAEVRWLDHTESKLRALAPASDPVSRGREVATSTTSPEAAR